MNEMVLIHETSLPSLVSKAAAQLAAATTAAEVLDAKDTAGLAYDASKRAARFAKAKGAHDEVVAAAYRAQADALEIESLAKRRLADEYDAAQERGEIAGPADRHSTSRLEANKASAADIGLTHKQVHEARQVRDAEDNDPGVIRRVLDARIASGQEPNRASIREAVTEAAIRGLRGSPAPSRRNPSYRPDPQWNAMLAVSAGCRDMMEKVRDLDPEYILGGFADTAQRHRNLRSIRECRDYLNLILELADAE